MRGWRTIHIYAPGLTKLGVTAWSPEARNKALPEKVVAVRAARASVKVNLIALPQGPVTVRIRGVAGPSLGRSAPTFFQLYHAAGLPPRAAIRPSAGPGGRALVYTEEFNGPISLSSEGRNPGADYAAAKPEFWGPAHFGEAIFADPALRFGNLGVVDGRYLRMAVFPIPADFAIPIRGAGAMLGRSSPRLGPGDQVSPLSTATSRPESSPRPRPVPGLPCG